MSGKDLPNAGMALVDEHAREAYRADYYAETLLVA